jgi:hypothetical protein
MPGKHFVYVHRRESDGSVFYVGQGKGRRATSRHRNKYWHAVANKHGFTAHKIAENLSQECALSIERAVIKHFGRGNLTNLTDGGDIGPTGYVMPEARKEKLREFRHSDRARAEISKKISGVNHPNYKPEKVTLVHPVHGSVTATRLEFRNVYGINLKKLAAMQRGAIASSKAWRLPHMLTTKRLTEETKAKISKALKGNKYCEGRVLSDEHRAKLSSALAGRKLPDEVREKRYGEGNPNYKLENISLSHPTHGAVSAPRSHFISYYGVPKGGLSDVLHGRQKSCRGWSVLD